MKLFKGFMIGLAGLFIFITLLSLFIPSRVITVKAIDINVPETKILQAITDLNAWKKWHPVLKETSAARVMDNDAGHAQSISWTTGKENTIAIVNQYPDGIAFDLLRDGGNPVENTLKILPSPDSPGRQVEWRAVTKLKWYPWEKFSGMFIDQLTGPGYEAALQSLKSWLETGATNPGS